MRWYWIDRFIEFQSGSHAKAVKHISLASEHMHDHFPGAAVMPASLIAEGFAQMGGMLFCEYNQFTENTVLARFPKLDVYFDALPGDTLTYATTVEYIKDEAAMVSATSCVGDRLQAEAEVVLANIRDDSADGQLFDPRWFHEMLKVTGGYRVGVAANGSPLKDPPPLEEALALRNGSARFAKARPARRDRVLPR